ncbi:DUF4249 domain-containing protein [Emticicia sp. 21SJ11W-3]|uniref:DUF4249 domain-containing protein n=1 Tax=Emticicia sp. 21SJ11W-3 TaxID=2916755 RepID=UPI0020A22A7F|nr:DUF4249 domain-containing protein [Emticicia sp. 21SJ11W-3]UTA69634.1 DUF4249 domain-containing protein [Emticicia sp. 21SJ11W-3]
MNKFIGVFCISLLLWVCSCVEPFSATFDGKSIFLTIDATLTDLDEQQRIKIHESVSSENNNYTIPVKNAVIELIVDEKEKIRFAEEENGIYSLPLSFRLKQGSSYQLNIQKADGRQYKSDKETLIKVADMVKVYDEFMPSGVPRGVYYDPANYVYIDTPDPGDQNNNYMWSWKLWELQDICTTCNDGRYHLTGTTNTPPGCRKEAGYENLSYDYFCDGNCWEILKSKDLNVFSDIYSNGKTISGRLVAKIPYYQEGGSLIEITQQSISPGAYRYLKLLADQVQNNGSLVDTPPAAIIGNVKNINESNEMVAGFFMVTSMKKIRYWISRENAAGKAYPVGLLDHQIIPEPTVNGVPDRPPLALCIESATRTKIEPKGWVPRVKKPKN